MTAVEDEYRMARKVFKDIYAENFENGFKYCLANYKTITSLTESQKPMPLPSIFYLINNSLSYQ